MQLNHNFFLKAIFISLYIDAKISSADILSPTAEKLNIRAKQNSNMVDRTDQYCSNKKIGDLCKILGDGFSGGGNGKCVRDLNEDGGTLDLNCELTDSFLIDRRLPDTPYQAEESICNKKDLRNVVCEAPPLIADQFCTDKRVNDVCVAKGQLKVLDKKTEMLNFQGKCDIKKETQHKYFRGHITLSRPVLLCSPLKPVPEKTYKTLSFFQRLWLSL